MRWMWAVSCCCWWDCCMKKKEKKNSRWRNMENFVCLFVQYLDGRWLVSMYQYIRLSTRLGRYLRPLMIWWINCVCWWCSGEEEEGAVDFKFQVSEVKVENKLKYLENMGMPRGSYIHACKIRHQHHSPSSFLSLLPLPLSPSSFSLSW